MMTLLTGYMFRKCGVLMWGNRKTMWFVFYLTIGAKRKELNRGHQWDIHLYNKQAADWIMNPREMSVHNILITRSFQKIRNVI